MKTHAQQIHDTSLALLADPGVRIEHDEIYDLLLENGATPGHGAQVVRFPAGLIDDCLKQCPSSFSLTDRFGAAKPAGEPVFWSSPGMSYGSPDEHRPFCQADMANMARLFQQLDHMDVVFGMAMNDVPPAACDVVGLSTIAQNCAKHVRVLCFSPQGADLLADMKQVVGDHAWLSIGFTAHGPLRWTNLALEIYRRTAGAGIPVTINGEPMAGTSAPVTLAGAAAVGNAEILAGIVVNQLLEPGRPCLYNFGLAHVFDMRAAVAVTGGPENALFAGVSAMMGRFYNLPSSSWVSTESMQADAQAGLEKSFGFHTHMSAGVNHIWGVGQLESELTLSPAQAVIDNEMIAYAKRFKYGITVSDETLALDVSRDVGIAGSFIEHEHTFAHYRSELFEPNLLFRGRRAAWKEQGSKRLDQRAHEQALQLMNRPVENGLSDKQAKALQDMADDFARRMT